MLGSGVAARERDFDGHGNDAGLEAAVEGADEADRVVVGIDQGDAIAGFQAAISRSAQIFVEQRVGYFLRSAHQFAVRQRHARFTIGVQDCRCRSFGVRR